jgi:LemA protein
MLIALIVVGAVVLLSVISLVVSYNRFVTQRNLVHESWRQIDVELQRRYDLIPNLIETVKGNAQRVHGSGSPTPAQQAVAEGALSGALSRLLITAEAYPDLKANQNFLLLQQQLVETEDRIAAGRRFYNGNVRALNTRVQSFPSNLIAGMFHFREEEYFEVNDPVVRATPRVDFSGLGTGSAPGHQQVPGGQTPALPQHYQPGYPQQQAEPTQPVPRAYPSAYPQSGQPGQPGQQPPYPQD